MGLDISAYSKLTFLRDRADDENYNYPFEICISAAPSFENRLGGMVPGIYSVDGEATGFRAGSYSGYNDWRDYLAEMVGATPEQVWAGHTPEAFGELINFSDCEGAIGTQTCAKLAADFERLADRAKEFAQVALAKSEEQAYWLTKYDSWSEAFRLASDAGAVCFH